MITRRQFLHQRIIELLQNTHHHMVLWRRWKEMGDLGDIDLAQKAHKAVGDRMVEAVTRIQEEAAEQGLVVHTYLAARDPESPPDPSEEEWLLLIAEAQWHIAV
tara:strand:- start:1270 stop:1581 length:312 start_codon:yes stop_codon:yes gene_type:complete